MYAVHMPCGAGATIGAFVGRSAGLASSGVATVIASTETLTSNDVRIRLGQKDIIPLNARRSTSHNLDNLSSHVAGVTSDGQYSCCPFRSVIFRPQRKSVRNARISALFSGW